MVDPRVLRGDIQPKSCGALWIPASHPTNCNGVDKATVAHKPR